MAGDCTYRNSIIGDASPLVLNLGYAHSVMVTQQPKKSGLTHWRLQRWSALPLAPLGVWFIYQVSRMDSSEYQVVLEWAEQPAHGIPLAVLIVALVIHATMGLQTVIEDYVKGVGRSVLIGVSHTVGAALGLAALIAILSL